MFLVKNVSPVSTAHFQQIWQGIVKKLKNMPFAYADAASPIFKIAVAYSGGPDSTALAKLAIDHFGVEKVHLITVDHNYKKWCDENIENVVQTARDLYGPKLNIHTCTLQWDETTACISNEPSFNYFKIQSNLTPAITKTNIQNMARDKRYTALSKTCITLAIPYLMTAHNFDDDWVTSCHRLARYSGIDGVAAMRTVSQVPIAAARHLSSDVLLIRPLLTVPKASLIETCNVHNLRWFYDASNDDEAFIRNASMKALVQLGPLEFSATSPSPNSNAIGPSSLTLNRLVNFVQRLKHHRSVINAKLAEAAKRSLIALPMEGNFVLCFNDRSWPFNTPIAWRLLSLCIQCVSNSPYPPGTLHMLQITANIQKAYTAYLRLLKKERSRIPKHLVAQFSTGESALFYETKRLDVRHQTTQRASLYPMSSSDAITRIREQKIRNKRQMAPGPCLLVTPSRCPQFKQFLRSVFAVDTGVSFVWLDKYRICIDAADPQRKWVVRPLTSEFMRVNQPLAHRSPVRAQILTFASSIPALFYFNFPVIFDADDQKKWCVPHLNWFSTEQPDFSVIIKAINENMLNVRMFLSE